MLYPVKNYFIWFWESFIILYAIYFCWLYPYRQAYHMDPAIIQQLKITYPSVQHFFPLIGCWSTTLFYLAAELWGAIVIILLFLAVCQWDHTNPSGAAIFTVCFGLLSHFALIVAGILGHHFYQLNQVNAAHDVFIYSGYCIVINGVIIMAIYRWINIKVLKPQLILTQTTGVTPTVDQTKNALAWKL